MRDPLIVQAELVEALSFSAAIAKEGQSFDKLRVHGVGVKSVYLIALGSNHPMPRHIIARAIGKLGLSPVSSMIDSRPIGPSQRTYANAVGFLESKHAPLALLKKLKKIERDHGRRPGKRWGARPLDLDIIDWSGGIWASPELTIPHPEFRKRRFVLAPLCEIAPDWRDPVTHLTARHLLARLDRKRASA